MNISGQYQVNGVPISASTLSNGVTGSGSIVLSNMPTLNSPTINGILGGSAFPSCPDVGGAHLNFTGSSGLLCGSSGSSSFDSEIRVVGAPGYGNVPKTGKGLEFGFTTDGANANSALIASYDRSLGLPLPLFEVASRFDTSGGQIRVQGGPGYGTLATTGYGLELGFTTTGGNANSSLIASWDRTDNPPTGLPLKLFMEASLFDTSYGEIRIQGASGYGTIPATGEGLEFGYTTTGGNANSGLIGVCLRISSVCTPQPLYLVASSFSFDAGIQTATVNAQYASSDPYGLYFPGYSQYAGNEMTLSMSGTIPDSSGGFRDALYVQVTDSDPTVYDYSHTNYGLRIAAFGPYSGGWVRSYKNHVALNPYSYCATVGTAPLHFPFAPGCSGINTNAVQFAEGIGDNEAYAGNPSVGNGGIGHSISLAGWQGIIDSSYADADSTHTAYAFLATNVGSHLATAAYGALSAPGERFMTLLDGGTTVVTISGIVMPGSATSYYEGTLINYGLNNGNPAGGSFTKWVGNVLGGDYEWWDGGHLIQQLGVITFTSGSGPCSSGCTNTALGVGFGTAPQTTLDTIGGVVRVQGAPGFGLQPTTGAGVEIAFDTTGILGSISSYDRGSLTFQPMLVEGSSLTLGGVLYVNNVVGTTQCLQATYVSGILSRIDGTGSPCGGSGGMTTNASNAITPALDNLFALGLAGNTTLTMDGGSGASSYLTIAGNLTVDQAIGALGGLNSPSGSLYAGGTIQAVGGFFTSTSHGTDTVSTGTYWAAGAQGVTGCYNHVNVSGGIVYGSC